jgi:hypothetical protein
MLFYSDSKLKGDTVAHDYYSIWFNLSTAFFISEKKTGASHKIKNPLFHLVQYHEMLKIILIVHISEIL